LSRAFAVFEPAGREAVLERLAYWWGMPAEVFDDHTFWSRSDSGTLWVAHRALAWPSGLVAESLGLLMAREPARLDRLSTGFFRRFGAHATRGVVELDATGEAVYLAGEDVHGAVADTDRGTRIAAGPSGILGRARCERGVLISELPRVLQVEREPRPLPPHVDGRR
jgi:hypothetical protein